MQQVAGDFKRKSTKRFSSNFIIISFYLSGTTFLCFSGYNERDTFIFFLNIFVVTGTISTL